MPTSPHSDSRGPGAPAAATSRRWLGPVLLLIAAGALFLLRGYVIPGERQPASPPAGALSGAYADCNVWLVTLDTTRYDGLSAYGCNRPTTPNIDAFAAEGVRFERCLSTAPITLPSHTSMMTATFPFVHRVRNNGRYLPDEGVTTIAEVLKQHGYATGAEVGAYVLDQVWGLGQGFDTYRSSTDETDPKPQVLQILEQQVPAADVAGRAIDWLNDHADGKFFLWTHFFDPHQPWDAPESFKARFADHPFGGYLAEICYMDSQIGRIWNEFKRHGVADNTIVVIVADHGEGLNEHGELTHTYFVYNTTMQVPLIIRCPRMPRPGHVVASPVRIVDAAPTVLDLLGLPPMPDVQGVSLVDGLGGGEVPDLTGYGETVSPHEDHGFARLRTIVVGEWKYIHAPTPELYHVTVDIGERENVADDHPEHLADLRAELENVVRSAQSLAASGATARQLDSVATARLAALGYVGGYAAASGEDEATLLGQFAGPDPKDHLDVMQKMINARAFARGGEREKAIELFNDMLKQVPKSPSVRKELANSLRRLGRTEEAAEQYEHMLELQPNNALAHYDYGLVLGELGRLDESIKHLRIAAGDMPENTLVLLYLGHGLFEQGKFAEAETIYRQVLALEPDNDQAFSELANVFTAWQQRPKALAALRDGLERKPDSVILLNNLAWLLATSPDPALRDGAEAVEVCNRIRKLIEVEDPALLDTFAAAYAAAGNFPAAVKTARRAVQLAREAGADELDAEITKRLQVYRQDQPYHESP